MTSDYSAYRAPRSQNADHPDLQRLQAAPVALQCHADRRLAYVDADATGAESDHGRTRVMPVDARAGSGAVSLAVSCRGREDAGAQPPYLTDRGPSTLLRAPALPRSMRS